MNWTEFFHMGGYAWHVWTSWGLTFAVLLVLTVQPKLNNAKIRARIARRMNRENKFANKTQPSSDNQANTDTPVHKD